MTLHSSRFGPSLHRYRAATTASADCCTSIPTPLDVSSPMADVQLSQGNARDLHVVSVGYTWRCSVQVLGITALCLLTPPPRLYPLPVRRTNTLPAASFRSRITPDTLAVRLPLPLAGCGGGLAPPKSPSHHHVGSDSASHGAARHAWRTKKGEGDSRLLLQSHLPLGGQQLSGCIPECAIDAHVLADGGNTTRAGQTTGC